MESNVIEAKCLEFKQLKFVNSFGALQFVVNLLVGDIQPFMRNLVNKLKEIKKHDVSNESVQRIHNVYVLCSDQIKKCFINFLDLIRIENRDGNNILECRYFLLERISWCYQRLLSTEDQLNKLRNNDELDSSSDSILLDSMYFVNWVDQTFEILSKMSSIVYKSNSEDELVECVRGLHTSIDELLLSAMTLCRYCLPSDQVVVKARCQVVLRETKALLFDIIEGDLDSEYQATKENLKLPIMPFNVSVLIDVLKDVLYALETNTNTSLLALLVHSFSQNVSPGCMLQEHLKKSHLSCSCLSENEDIDEKCEYVKSFDTYNERLLQIGTFAMSCSCDEKRILGLRSGLASLEALDPHLVPALMLSPTSPHSSMLLNIWTEEVMQIRNNVFLIVDPSAFAEKTKQIMQQKLLELLKEHSYNNTRTCEVINIGQLVYEFFDVYNKEEPEALPQCGNLKFLLDNLYRAQMECKIVSNSLCSDADFMYDIKKKNITVDYGKLVKRLQLLYTVVKRIYHIFVPKDNDDDFYNDEPAEVGNGTYTLNIKKQTYIQSQRKPVNVTKSIFARTINMRNSPRKLPLAILTRHLKTKTDLSFSIKLDDIDLSEVKKNRESSILYHPNVKSRSLRKAVLSKHIAVKCDIDNETLNRSQRSCKESFMDDSMNLQITDVLNQLNDLTTNVAENMRRPFNSTAILDREDRPSKSSQEARIGGKEVDSLNITQPSEVNTLERIKDLELVESKLSDLRFGHIETSL